MEKQPTNATIYRWRRDTERERKANAAHPGPRAPASCWHNEASGHVTSMETRANDGAPMHVLIISDRLTEVGASFVLRDFGFDIAAVTPVDVSGAQDSTRRAYAQPVRTIDRLVH